MEDLAPLHATATSVQVRTAEKLGPYDATSVYKLGRLLITSVSLKDSGLRGGKGLVLEGQPDYIADPDEDREMQGLGLPTAFGNGPQKMKAGHQNHPKRKPGAASPDKAVHSPPGMNGHENLEEPASQPAAPPLGVHHAILGTASAGSSFVGTVGSALQTACSQPDVYQDPAVISATLRQNFAASQVSSASRPQPQLQLGGQVQHQQLQHPLHSHPHHHQHLHPQQQQHVPSGPSIHGLVQVVHVLNAHGYNLPLVWHAMGLYLTPANVTPADIFAAAQVAGAPPELVHHALQAALDAPGLNPAAAGPGLGPRPAHAGAGPIIGRAISCSALEQRLNSLTLSGIEAALPGQGPEVHPQQGHPSSVGLGQGSGQGQGLGFAASHQPLGAGQQGASGVNVHSPWQQGFDPASGHFYYYNVAAQITQWEVPAQGYQLCAMSSSALEQGLLQQSAVQPRQSMVDPYDSQRPGHQQPQPQPQPQQQGQPERQQDHPSSRMHLQHLQQQQQQHSSPQRQHQQSHEQQQQQLQPQQPRHQGGGCNGRHAHGKSAGAGPNGKHGSSDVANPNLNWQQLEMLQRAAVDSPDGYASPCMEGEEQERVEVDAKTAAFVRNILPRNMAKYWLQRYSLFSKYDEGIQMDTEGWYSVTPEVLALHQAQMCKRYGGGHIVADAMAGCGGNVIQMAMVFPQVIGVEISPRRCGMAAHNVDSYGVASRVNMLCADFFAVAPELLADAIFVSPPWGGPAYQYCEAFDVLSSPIDGQRSVADLLQVCLGVVARTWRQATADRRSKGSVAAGAGSTALVEEPAQPRVSADTKPEEGRSNGEADTGSRGAARLEAEPLCAGDCKGRGVVSLFLPRNSDLHQLESLVPSGSVWLVERNFVNSKLKGVTVYCF